MDRSLVVDSPGRLLGDEIPLHGVVDRPMLVGPPLTGRAAAGLALLAAVLLAAGALRFG